MKFHLNSCLWETNKILMVVLMKLKHTSYMKMYKLNNLINDKDINEIISKGFSFMLIRILGLIAGYVFIYLVTKFYGASVYGLVALGFSLFIFSGIIGRMGIDINLVKFYSSDEHKNDNGLFYKVLLLSLAVSSIIATVLYFGKGIVVYRLFKKPELDPYIFWVALAIPFWAAILICAGYLRARKKNRWFAFLNNPGRFLLTILFLIVLWSFNDSHMNVIKAHTYGVMGLSILAFYQVVKSMGAISIKTKQKTGRFIKEAYPMMLSTTMLILLGWMDTFVLGIYSGSDEIGIYNVALKIATLTSFALEAINSILAPKLAESFSKGEKQKFAKQVRISTKLNFFSTLAIVLVILPMHKWLLGIFGEEFVVGSFILIILCIGQFINSFSGSVGIILQMTGNQKTYQNIVFVALALNILLNFVLIPKYGGLGAAIATASSMAVRNLLGATFLKKKMGITTYYTFK